MYRVPIRAGLIPDNVDEIIAVPVDPVEVDSQEAVEDTTIEN